MTKLLKHLVITDQTLSILKEYHNKGYHVLAVNTETGDSRLWLNTYKSYSPNINTLHSNLWAADINNDIPYLTISLSTLSTLNAPLPGMEQNLKDLISTLVIGPKQDPKDPTCLRRDHLIHIQIRDLGILQTFGPVRNKPYTWQDLSRELNQLEYQLKELRTITTIENFKQIYQPKEADLLHLTRWSTYYDVEVPSTTYPETTIYRQTKGTYYTYNPEPKTQNITTRNFQKHPVWNYKTIREENDAIYFYKKHKLEPSSATSKQCTCKYPLSCIAHATQTTYSYQWDEEDQEVIPEYNSVSELDSTITCPRCGAIYTLDYFYPEKYVKQDFWFNNPEYLKDNDRYHWFYNHIQTEDYYVTL